MVLQQFFNNFFYAFQLELAQKHTEDIPNICMVLGRTRLIITTIHNISRYMGGNFEHIKEWDAFKKKYQFFFSEGAVIRTKCNSKIETETIVIWNQYPRAQKTNKKNSTKNETNIYN